MRRLGHNPPMLKIEYKGALYLLAGSVIRFAFEAGVFIINAKTHYSLVHTHVAIIRASEGDCSVEGCHGWNCN